MRPQALSSALTTEQDGAPDGKTDGSGDRLAETPFAPVEVDGHASHDLVDEDDAQVDVAVDSLAPYRSTGEPAKVGVRAASDSQRGFVA